MAQHEHVHASISFHVSYDSDVHSVPEDAELLAAYQALEDYIHTNKILIDGPYTISFEIGGQGSD